MSDDNCTPATIEAALETNIFTNQNRTITIQQYDPFAIKDSSIGETVTITFHPRHARAVIRAINAAVKELRDA